MTRVLAAHGIITRELAASLRDIYKICSVAVHGEPVSHAQVDFVNEASEQLIDLLWGLAEGAR